MLNKNEIIVKSILKSEFQLQKAHPQKDKMSGNLDLMGYNESEDKYWEVEVKGLKKGGLFDDESKSISTLRRNQIRCLISAGEETRTFVMFVDRLLHL